MKANDAGRYILDVSELQRLLHEHGHYTVIREIGSGAMAKVFLARREGPGGFMKEVAIKVASIRSFSIPDLPDRVRDEARLAGTLRHDNIVQVTNFIELDGYLAIELELVEGLTLLKVMEIAWKNNIRIPPAFSKAVICDVLDALDYLRLVETGVGSGIVHRDIKPANIFVNMSGVTKVSDFGIAHIPGEERTQRGVLLGTYRYLPLEAFSGRAPAHSWDIWASSIIFWELLAQRRVFAINKDLSPRDLIFHAVRSLRRLEVRPPAELRPDVPRALSELSVRALGRNIEDRFPNAGAMRLALLETEPSLSSPRDTIREFVDRLVHRHRDERASSGVKSSLGSIPGAVSRPSTRAKISTSPSRVRTPAQGVSAVRRVSTVVMPTGGTSADGRTLAPAPTPEVTRPAWQTQTIVTLTIVVLVLAFRALGPDEKSESAAPPAIIGSEKQE